jgi:hypothetical protein
MDLQNERKYAIDFWGLARRDSRYAIISSVFFLEREASKWER